jgi:IMP dehydrogenase
MDAPVEKIMTRENLITANEGITLDQAEETLKKYKIEKLPIVNKKGKLTGLITFKDIQKRKKQTHSLPG